MLKITLKGLKEVLARLVRKERAIKRGINEALENVGQMVVYKSREYVPEDSGQLKEDIAYKVGRNFVEVGVPRGSASSPYAYFIHYGRYNEGPETRSKANGGRMFITRAIRDLNREIKREFDRALEAN